MLVVGDNAPAEEGVVSLSVFPPFIDPIHLIIQYLCFISHLLPLTHSLNFPTEVTSK